MSERVPNFFATRHSLKPTEAVPESVNYGGLSEEGIHLAQERAKDILALIDTLPEGAIVVLGGVSDFPRTRSTLEIYGDTIRQLLAESGRTDIKILSPEEMKEVSSVLQGMRDEIQAGPSTKYVIQAPLYLKNFSPKGVFVGQDGQFTPYVQALLEMSDGDEHQAMEEWFKGQGKLGDFVGPTPKDVAENYLDGIRRLHAFAQRQVPGRPLAIGTVGHSWALDALAVYLISGGDVSYDALQSVDGSMIGECEMVRIEEKDGHGQLMYGDRVLDIPQGLEATSQ